MYAKHLIDGEGTFYIGIYKNKTMKTGFIVILEFVITQHKRDLELMYKFKEFFSAFYYIKPRGYVIKDGETKYIYRIRDVQLIEKSLIPLLNDYPLMTLKRLGGEATQCFKEALELIKSKEHLTLEGEQSTKKFF